MTRSPANPERSFGLSVGPVLVAVSLYFLWGGRIRGAVVLGVLGLLLLVAGLIRPILLKWPSVVWWRLSRALGYVNARVLLTVIFVLVFTPIGLLWRAIGKDPLGRRRTAWQGWSPHPPRYRSRSHYSRMF